MKTFTFAGKISTFGGPTDSGVGHDENLAFIHLDDLAEWRFNHLFLPASGTGLARRLDPEAFYIACRWDYSETSKNIIRNSMVLVEANGRACWAQPADWGPHIDTERAMDLSPGLARALELKTDDEAVATLCAPISDSTEPPNIDLPEGTGKRVMLLVGHHPVYDGAAGHGTTEFTYNKDLVYRIAKHVKKAEITVAWREKSSWNQDQISRIVDAWNPDAVLEFHLNYFDGISNQKGTGTEMLYISSAGKAIASRLQDAAVGVLELADRGIKYRPNLTLLKRTKAPAVILESGFIDEAADMAALTTRKDELAKAYASVIDSIA